MSKMVPAPGTLGSSQNKTPSDNHKNLIFPQSTKKKGSTALHGAAEHRCCLRCDVSIAWQVAGRQTASFTLQALGPLFFARSSDPGRQGPSQAIVDQPARKSIGRQKANPSAVDLSRLECTLIFRDN